MFKELTLQNIGESEMPVENGSTFKFKSTLWWPTLVEGLKCTNYWSLKPQNESLTRMKSPPPVENFVGGWGGGSQPP
jgi:hypothetical protein